MAFQDEDELLETGKLISDSSDSKKKKNKKKQKQYLNKNTLSILRTTLRNNIELTSIADNKANVLLSLNALMLTFLVPLTLPYIDRIIATNLWIPMIVLALTCLITIYLAVLVLKPGKFAGQGIKMDGNFDHMSPFFFGNFQNMDKNDFLDYASDVLSDEYLVKSFVSNDFYHIGLRLAQKMKIVRSAFNIFIYGMSTSILLTITMLLIYG